MQIDLESLLNDTSGPINWHALSGLFRAYHGVPPLVKCLSVGTVNTKEQRGVILCGAGKAKTKKTQWNNQQQLSINQECTFWEGELELP